jgi:hypothetical protein
MKLKNKFPGGALVILGVVIVNIALVGAVAWVAAHFIRKWW